MPIFTKKNGLIYCVYYDKGKKIWESFGRGVDAKRAAEARDLEIRLKKTKTAPDPEKIQDRSFHPART